MVRSSLSMSPLQISKSLPCGTSAPRNISTSSINSSKSVDSGHLLAACADGGFKNVIRHSGHLLIPPRTRGSNPRNLNPLSMLSVCSVPGTTTLSCCDVDKIIAASDLSVVDKIRLGVGTVDMSLSESIVILLFSISRSSVQQETSTLWEIQMKRKPFES